MPSQYEIDEGAARAEVALLGVPLIVEDVGDGGVLGECPLCEEDYDAEYPWRWHTIDYPLGAFLAFAEHVRNAHAERIAA